MNDIEKNDVDISKLFQWGDSMELQTPSGKTITVWMRIIGDSETNRARVYALRQSADLRKKLKDENSDERIAMIPELDETDKDKVIEILLALNIKELTDRAYENMDIKYPKEPASDASLEEQEQYQAIIDGFPKYVEERTNEILEKEINRERKNLAGVSIEGLKQMYFDLLLRQLCETEMYKSFQDMTVYFACYKDPDYTERLFSSFDAFDNLPTSVKEVLATFYGTLTIDIDNLKKSPEVMQ